MFWKFIPFKGPSAWVFEDPDTSRKFTGRTLQEICAEVRGYRNQNSLDPLDFLETVIESYTCQQKENIGGCEPLPKLKRGMFGFLKGGIALIQNVFYDRTVSQEVADKRADICITCPHNVFLDRGMFVVWSDSLAKASVGDKKVKHYKELGNCEICSCCLKVKPWYVGPFKFNKKELDEFPDFCWQKKEAIANAKK